MQQLYAGQPALVPGLLVEQVWRTHGDQQLREQLAHFPFRREHPVAEQHRAIERLLVEVHMVDIHPGAGQLHLVARLQMAKAAKARQQPAHGQGRGGLHAQDVILTAQGIASPLQRGKAFTHTGQQHPRGFGQLQAAAAADEQAAGKMLLQRADMPADRALGNRQLFAGTGEGAQPRGGFECAQGIQRGELTGHEAPAIRGCEMNHRKAYIHESDSCQ